MILKALTKFVFAKHTDTGNIKDLIKYKTQKDRIFAGIFENFTTGKKLLNYEEYLRKENEKPSIDLDRKKVDHELKSELNQTFKKTFGKNTFTSTNIKK